MQLSGKVCEICSGSIVIQGEGTWCAVCSSTFHRVCLDRTGSFCPNCEAPCDRAEPHFVASDQCPSCWKASGRDIAVCPCCGGTKQFDTETAYEARLTEMHSAGRWMVGVGIFLGAVGWMIPTAALILTVSIGVGVISDEFGFLVVMAAPLWPIILFAGGVIAPAMINSGMKRLHDGRRACRFR
jgi:hypothetical protein